ncbi:MAG TPA: YCF48-related protein [Bacteroidia bacterium]|nr:YCF48-related protein [Bacteroidia bacterium]
MKKLFALLSLAIALSPFTLKAQWDTLITNTTTNFTSGAFYSADSGVVVGYDATTNTGKIFYTIDGGTTWPAAAANFSLPRLNAVCFFANATGLAAGDSGKVFMSINGGLTWIMITPKFTSEDITSISMPTNSSFFLGGKDGGLYNTLDGGLTWDTLNSGTTLPITDLDFIYANTGWVIGDGGYMGITADGGQTWNYFPQPYFGFFMPRGIAYAGTTNNAYCVGESGLAIYSADAGLTWNEFYTPSVGNLNSVKFGSDNSGIICGDDNFIYRTNNGGAWWLQDSVPGANCDLNKVCWADPSTCYIVGTNGRILKNNTDITGIKTVQQENFSASVYPNPFDGALHVNYQLDKNSTVQIAVIDELGRILFSETTEQVSGEQHYELNDAAQLAPGLYFVNVTADNKTVSIPVLKK